jgi:hypothetical protein
MEVDAGEARLGALESSNGIPALRILLSGVGRAAAECLYLPDLPMDRSILHVDFPMGGRVWWTAWRKAIACAWKIDVPWQTD